MKKFISILVALSFIGFAYAEGKGKGKGKGKRGHYFEKMDTDKDGKISKEEWNSFHEQKFTKKDKNGDGFITKDEMRHGKKGKRHKKQQ